MTDATYENLISEAFIDPIRSVLIVDDDYPTLNEILAEGKEEQEYRDKGKRWRQDKTSVRDIVQQFRDPKAPLLLDIHDGTVPDENKDAERVDELQQTDLLILDYQLEPGVEHGDHALRIARRALSNEHFNLILVHTKEELGPVFFEFLTGLYEPIFLAERDKDSDAVVDAFEAEYGDALGKSLSPKHLAIALHRPKEWTGKLCGNDPEWNGPRIVLEQAAKDVADFTKNKWRTAVIRVFAEMEAQRPPYDCDRPIKVLDWHDEEAMYVRTDRGFMAFKWKKEEPPVPLLDTVKFALNSWSPRPSRLLLTKLRAVMDKRGIEVQDDALGRPHIGAIWYRDLLGTRDALISAAVDRTVRNHAEQLLDQILPDVREFAHRMIALENSNAAAEVVRKRFGVNLSAREEEGRAVMAHNAFVGSKPVTGDHLELGHILAINGQKWLCVTPACDLVPGQAGGGNRPDKGGNLKRFTALRLHEMDEVNLLETATRGGRIFVNLIENDGNATARAFQTASDDNASPAWIIMYAENDGILTKVDEKSCIRVRFVKMGDGGPGLARFEASVVGHIRPEYALDVQARLTDTQSRIGLDLKGLPTKDSDVD